MSDLIDRQAAIDALGERPVVWNEWADEYALGQRNQYDVDKLAIETLPPAQQTLCGYKIEHLIMIANILKKENLPPERLTEALTDIGRVVAIVRDEFEETLRKAVEQCMI